MFRGSAYSIETDKEMINGSDLMEEEVQIALVGVSDVGKSSIVGCIDNQKFRDDISNTQGFQIRFKKLRISNYIINLYVWDGAGDNILHFIQEGHLDKIDSVLYVFDLTDENSLLQLQQIHLQLKKYFQKKQKNLIALVVGNKADLIINSHKRNSEDDYVNYMAEKFSQRHDLLYLKVSAKKNNFITDTFVELIRQTLRSRQECRTSRIFGEEEEPGKKQSSGWCKNCRNCSLCAIF